MIEVTFRPIDVWPADAPGGGQPSPFRAKWASTMELLDRELRAPPRAACRDSARA